jgi:2-polyprenyl-3-methyl-5-hydroxy-6-metoxy-1,4-benzoquinol methylase
VRIVPTTAYRCPVCGSAALRLLFGLKSGNLRQCTECSHVFSTDIAVLPTDLYGSEYFRVSHKNWFANPDYRLFEQIAGSICGAAGKSAAILDIGCGTGNFLKYLHMQGYTDLHGLDLIRNEHEAVRFYHGDIYGSVLARQFDVVVSMMNIEHVHDAHAYVEKIKSLLSPHGLGIINTIDESSLIYRLSRILKFAKVDFAAERLYDTHHVNHFSESTLKRLLSSHGLLIVETFKSNYPLNSLDVGDGPAAVLTKAAIALVNVTSRIIGREIAQTVLFRKAVGA